MTDLDYPINETHKEGNRVISTTLFMGHHLETIFEALTTYLCFLTRDYKALFSHVTDDYIALSLAKSLSDYFYNYTDFDATNAFLKALEVHNQVINQIIGSVLFQSLSGR